MALSLPPPVVLLPGLAICVFAPRPPARMCGWAPTPPVALPGKGQQVTFVGGKKSLWEWQRHWPTFLMKQMKGEKDPAGASVANKRLENARQQLSPALGQGPQQISFFGFLRDLRSN